MRGECQYVMYSSPESKRMSVNRPTVDSSLSVFENTGFSSFLWHHQLLTGERLFYQVTPML